MRLLLVFALAAFLAPGLFVTAQTSVPGRHELNNLREREATPSTATASETFSDTASPSVTESAITHSNSTASSNATLPASTTTASLNTSQASKGKRTCQIHLFLFDTDLIERWQELNQPRCPSYPAHSYTCSGNRRFHSHRRRRCPRSDRHSESEVSSL